MTTRALFATLCTITSDLQAECVRLDFSPHKLALDALVGRLDALIDLVIDEGIHDERE